MKVIVKLKVLNSNTKLDKTRVGKILTQPHTIFYGKSATIF